LLATRGERQRGKASQTQGERRQMNHDTPSPEATAIGVRRLALRPVGDTVRCRAVRIARTA
jgi:hypothetical protein